MASRKIEELTEDDLNFVEKLLGKEFSKQSEESARFKSKNHYERDSSDLRKISKILDAIRSEKYYRNKINIKW